ncbi:cuticle protein 8-like [Homarus americanus]|nr:cuticle protein 8-like [Homarus americanus]
MNALTVLCLVAAAASCSSQLSYPGVYGGAYSGYPGVYGGYPGVYGGYSGVYGGYPGVYGGYPSASPINALTPYNAAPLAPVSPVQSKYHLQDELGQYSFGYAGGPSTRSETRDAFGNVRGHYNYIDADGKVQTQHYVADALGFRVAGTNLPVAPDAPAPVALAAPGPLPEPVQDTPEVAAAKAAFQAAYDEAAAAAAAAPDSRKKRSLVAAPALTPYSAFGFPYGFTGALNYAHPGVFGSHLGYSAAYPYATLRDAELLRIIHNPGHAVSYRVD